jgi:hypothetical protein
VRLVQSGEQRQLNLPVNLTAGIFLKTMFKIGKILFELLEREANRKNAFQFTARQATHRTFASKQRYLGCARIERDL